MEPIKILHIVEMISENSGVSSVVLNYYRNMDQKKFVFDFMTHTEVSPDVRKMLEGNGSCIYTMPELSGRNISLYQKKLDEFFEQHEGEYQIIHGHLPNAAAFYMKAAKKHGNQVRILHSHNSCGADSTLKRMRNYFLNHMGVRASNVYFACSKPAAEYLYGKTNRKKVFIINNAIELETFAYNPEMREQLRKKYQVENKVVIGHVGRFAEQKNHKFIIEIAKLLKEHKKEFVFLLVGDGKLRVEIENRVRKEHLEQYVLFTGSVSDPQDYFQMMDMFVLPSFYEGLPVVGVEAQAAGLPCIISDTITKEVLLTDGIKQLPIQNANHWAEEILHMPIQRQKDSIKQIREKGFDIKQEAKRLEEIYDGLAGK